MLAQALVSYGIFHCHRGLIGEKFQYIEFILIVIILLQARTKNDKSIEPLLEL